MKTVSRIVAVLLALLLLIGGFAGSVWVAFSRSAAFADADQGKADIFAGKKVMVIVPHEDDELNLFGGLFEEYLKYGSNVKVVFVTNGDLYLPRETRIREAINALSEVGVTEDNIVFLGYGDGYLYKHLYNAYDGERLISEAGFMETHGADFHPAFIEEHPFTRENYIEDIKACILQEKPDVIFCNDYDSHTDHQAVSLAFEEAMGSILRENFGYQPVVYKGYAYSTAFYAPEDFYSDPNLLSTKN
ncbi:MAG: PIG-L family deacetylase, partial [Oscillospiraceae bacterium]|nr:PIG-L family deacetylase [Oscillospiraceae bacterium]